MKALYRGFLIMMLLLLALGVALVMRGAREHQYRPVTPPSPDGVAHAFPMPGEEKPHV